MHWPAEWSTIAVRARSLRGRKWNAPKWDSPKGDSMECVRVLVQTCAERPRARQADRQRRLLGGDVVADLQAEVHNRLSGVEHSQVGRLQDV